MRAFPHRRVPTSGTGAAVAEQKRALVRCTSKLEVVVVGGVVVHHNVNDIRVEG